MIARKPTALGTQARNGGDRQRRALINVWSVKMKRHRRDPETKARHHKHNREHAKLDLGHVRQFFIEESQRLQVADPHRAIQERQAVEQQRR